MHHRFSTFIAAFSSAIAAPACAASSERPAAVIAYGDLDMRSPEQRQILISRIDRVAFELCRKEAETRRLGEHFNRFGFFYVESAFEAAPQAIVQLLANAAPRHDDGQGPDDGPASAPPDALVPADA